MYRIEHREAVDAYIQFHRLERVLPDRLRSHAAVYVFAQGENICVQGEPASTLYVLVKGKIKVFHNSPEGKTLVLSFRTPLEVIGDLEYIGGDAIHNYVEAVTEASMIGISYRALRESGEDHAPLLRFLLEMMVKKLNYRTNHSSLNLMYPVEARFSNYLLSVCCDETDARFRGRLPVANVQDTANLLGTSYRHLNRVIRKLCDEGLIERNKSYIQVLEPERLKRLAGSLGKEG
ncbi:Crp/Fnr family transcriptional regulator [Paenibacillus sp.]|uniref:Crp/Fnr family transcriptional regulator n=1 Tax=Paenibacillus sp. TaxID=58172 RepID=UPI002811EDAA|nr:Crp/Fnr family transcriptional regulator [Paenibacillus sp.]